MKLIVGGYAQGKRAYLETIVQKIADGGLADEKTLEEAQGIDKLHLLSARWMEQGKDPTVMALTLAEKNPEIIFVCDEIGCGIVPMERKERGWREAVGRMCCALAAQAQQVERVICGIPMVIKS